MNRLIKVNRYLDEINHTEENLRLLKRLTEKKSSLDFQCPESFTYFKTIPKKTCTNSINSNSLR